MEVASSPISCPFLENNAQNAGLMVKTNWLKFEFLGFLGLLWLQDK